MKKGFHFIKVALAMLCNIFVLFGCGAKITTEKADRLPQIKKILVYTSNKWETRWMIKQFRKRAIHYEVDGTWYDRMAFNNDELLNEFIKKNPGDVLLRVDPWQVKRRGFVHRYPTLEDLNTGRVIWRAIIECNASSNHAKIIINQLKKDGILLD